MTSMLKDWANSGPIPSFYVFSSLQATTRFRNCYSWQTMTHLAFYSLGLGVLGRTWSHTLGLSAAITLEASSFLTTLQGKRQCHLNDVQLEKTSLNWLYNRSVRDALLIATATMVRLLRQYSQVRCTSRMGKLLPRSKSTLDIQVSCSFITLKCEIKMAFTSVKEHVIQNMCIYGKHFLNG